MAVFLRCYLALNPSHERASRGFYHVVGGDRQPVDLEDALDLHEQPVKEPKITASDAGNRRDRLGIGEVRVAERQAELAPMAGEDQGLRMKDAGEDLLHVSVVPCGHFPPALQACL
jgi:hypothetical protein